MALTRRDICVLLPALLSTATGHSATDSTASDQVLRSAIYNLNDLTLEKSKNREYIQVFEGNMSNGLHMTLHESGIGPGGVIHEMYSHPGDELFLVREGTLEVDMDGKRFQVSPGGVAYVAGNTRYAVRNSSKEWARYFVFLFGPSDAPIQWG